MTSALRITAIGVVFCATWTAAVTPPAQPPSQRIVAVGDIHGAADAFAAILQSAGLIDAQRHWIGGRSRFIQTGDILDRGPAVRDVLELLMRLEDEAKRAGGRVDVLFGNHEGMNILHEFRDVSPEAYKAFADGDSETKRSRAFTSHASIAVRAGAPLDRNEWMRTHPPGFLEYAESMGPSGRYGRWLRSRKPVLKVDDSIFMHAGIPVDSTSSPDDINRTVEREVRAFDEAASALQSAGLIAHFFSLQETMNACGAELNRLAAMRGKDLPPDVTQEYVGRLQRLMTINQWALIAADGPLWYRGYASLGEEAKPKIEALLKRLAAARFVVGHTAILTGRIMPRFDNHVFLIDTGMLSSHYKGGRASALEFADGQITAVYSDQRETLTSIHARFPSQHHPLAVVLPDRAR